MNKIIPSSPVERVAMSWVVAGIALLVLVGVSVSVGDPVGGAQEVPVYAIDEELPPLPAG